MTTQTVKSTSLQRRINRALDHNALVLRKCREDSQYHHERGNYYIVDVQTGGISETHVDLENLARELNVLKVTESPTEPEIGSEAPKIPLSEKEFTARTRQMQRELRVMTRRINELMKKDRYGGLSKEERVELEQLFKDATKKAADNVNEAVRLSGFEWVAYRHIKEAQASQIKS